MDIGKLVQMSKTAVNDLKYWLSLQFSGNSVQTQTDLRHLKNFMRSEFKKVHRALYLLQSQIESLDDRLVSENSNDDGTCSSSSCDSSDDVIFDANASWPPQFRIEKTGDSINEL